MASCYRTRPSDQHALSQPAPAQPAPAQPSPVQPSPDVYRYIDYVDSSSEDEDTPVPVPSPENDDDAANPDEGCGQDPISRLREIVMAIRASRQRCEALTTWMENGNRNRLFITLVEHTQLLLDVRTRWVSTYGMVERCIEMRPVSHVLHLAIIHFIHFLYTLHFRPSIPS